MGYFFYHIQELSIAQSTVTNIHFFQLKLRHNALDPPVDQWPIQTLFSIFSFKSKFNLITMSNPCKELYVCNWGFISRDTLIMTQLHKIKDFNIHNGTIVGTFVTPPPKWQRFCLQFIQKCQTERYLAARESQICVNSTCLSLLP